MAPSLALRSLQLLHFFVPSNRSPLSKVYIKLEAEEQGTESPKSRIRENHSLIPPKSNSLRFAAKRIVRIASAASCRACSNESKRALTHKAGIASTERSPKSDRARMAARRTRQSLACSNKNSAVFIGLCLILCRDAPRLKKTSTATPSTLPSQPQNAIKTFCNALVFEPDLLHV